MGIVRRVGARTVKISAGTPRRRHYNDNITPRVYTIIIYALTFVRRYVVVVVVVIIIHARFMAGSRGSVANGLGVYACTRLYTPRHNTSTHTYITLYYRIRVRLCVGYRGHVGIRLVSKVRNVFTRTKNNKSYDTIIYIYLYIFGFVYAAGCTV